MLCRPGVIPAQEPGPRAWRREGRAPRGCSLVPVVLSLQRQSRALEPRSRNSSCWAVGKKTRLRGEGRWVGVEAMLACIQRPALVSNQDTQDP